MGERASNALESRSDEEMFGESVRLSSSKLASQRLWCAKARDLARSVAFS